VEAAAGMPAAASATPLQALHLLGQVQAVLQEEFRIAVETLVAATREREDGSSGANAEDDAKLKEQREREERMRREDEEKLAAMTPEQREKTLEKRRKKAEKAAAKAAKKASRSGAAGKLGLGLGGGVLSVLQKCLPEGRELDSSALEDLIAARGSLLDVFAAADAAARALGSNPVVKCIESLASMETGSGRRVPKIARGTRDFHPSQMRVREEAFGIIRRVFKMHGAVEIDTPVFELKETLTGKYGEDTKLIYDLADQGGEILALRYDLTVPFARYLAMHAPGNIKRFHMAKVYRRDNPQLARGRYREFYQCDFDIAGTYDVMVADAEVLSVVVSILGDLPIGPFKIKLNDRRILDAIFEICGCPAAKFRTICSAVDKLDKEPWETVKAEMLDKGLDEAAADRIGEFVTLTAEPGRPFDLLRKLEGGPLASHPSGSQAIGELATLFGYLESMGALPRISLDMSLARGLDYYTGVIYEAVLLDNRFGVGSIAAGGRYDNLVGMFSGNATPCVGVSVGVERVFAIMERLMEERSGDELRGGAQIQVLVASVGNDLLRERMNIAQRLWESGISAEFGLTGNRKFTKQLQDALERRIPFMVIIGADELKRRVVKVKNLREKYEHVVPFSAMVEELVAQGVQVHGAQKGDVADTVGDLQPDAEIPGTPVLITATKRFSSLNLRA